MTTQDLSKEIRKLRRLRNEDMATIMALESKSADLESKLADKTAELVKLKDFWEWAEDRMLNHGLDDLVEEFKRKMARN